MTWRGPLGVGSSKGPTLGLRVRRVWGPLFGPRQQQPAGPGAAPRSRLSPIQPRHHPVRPIHPACSGVSTCTTFCITERRLQLAGKISLSQSGSFLFCFCFSAFVLFLFLFFFVFWRFFCFCFEFGLWSQTIHIAIHFVLNQLLISMESQGSPGKQIVGGGAHPQTRNSLHNDCPSNPHHFSMDLEERGIPCPFFIPTLACPQFQVMGLDHPPKARIAPQPTSQMDHLKEGPKNLSLTSPIQTRNGEPPGRKWRLLN